jgi:hypothetical protein
VNIGGEAAIEWKIPRRVFGYPLERIRHSQRIGGFDLVIHSNIELVDIVALCRASDVRPGRRIREREELQKESCLRRDLAGRYHVAGKRRSCERISDWTQAGEIAAPHCGCRHRRIKRQSFTNPRAFIISKEERAVLLNGTTKGKAELVLREWRARDREKVPGVQRAVAKEIVCVAVILIGAGFYLDVDNGSSEPVSRIQRVALYFELLKGIWSRIESDTAD